MRAAEYGIDATSAIELFKQASHDSDGAPTLDQINAYYKNIGDILKSNSVDAKSVEKKDIVKNVPVTSKYREFVDEAKKQNIGLIKRHMLAMLTRPAVWGGSNAFFIPEGKHGLVVSSNKINPDVIRHELGHAEDYARLGGKEKFDKEYNPGFWESLKTPSRELYNRRYLLPEARAWHYAGSPVAIDPNDPNRVRDRAFNSYVNFVDQMIQD
jgi:hypothetical protein